MLNIYTIAFFGHRRIENSYEVEAKLEQYIFKFLFEHEYVDFLVGRNGDFDRHASSAIRKARKKRGEDNSSLVLMLPYLTAEYLNNKDYYHDYYTDVEISYTASISHPKSAIQIRNREMADRADLIICYIEHKKGGAWQTVDYAIKQGKKVINLANEI